MKSADYALARRPSTTRAAQRSYTKCRILLWIHCWISVIWKSAYIQKTKKRQYNFTATNFSISSVSWDHISVKGILLFKGIFMLMLQLAQTIVLMLKHWLSVWNTNTSCDQLCRLHGTWHFVRGRVDPGKDASVSVQGYHMHTHTHK